MLEENKDRSQNKIPRLSRPISPIKKSGTNWLWNFFVFGGYFLFFGGLIAGSLVGADQTWPFALVTFFGLLLVFFIGIYSLFSFQGIFRVLAFSGGFLILTSLSSKSTFKNLPLGIGLGMALIGIVGYLISEENRRGTLTEDQLKEDDRHWGETWKKGENLLSKIIILALLIYAPFQFQFVGIIYIGIVILAFLLLILVLFIKLLKFFWKIA